MSKYTVLYNPYSKNNHGEDYARKLDDIMQNSELTYMSMPAINNFNDFFKEVTGDIIICGGDGTLNYFINKTSGINYKNEIWYYATGSGNDFNNDVNPKEDKPYVITNYLKNLPTVLVKGQKYTFINNVGYGIDGYCCEVGDREKKKSVKPVNYTKVAIKGLLYDFKPKKARITADDKMYVFDNVWLAPTMNGRYYGGGMMVSPDQNRLNEKHELTLVVYHCKNKLKTLSIFPSIFEGKHVLHKDVTEVITGYNFKVEFDTPCALQIDGETILNVKEYEAHAFGHNK